MALSASADWLGIGGGGGFGSLQLLLAVIGLGALLFGVLPAAWIPNYARLVCAIASGYLCLVLLEAVVSTALGPERSATRSLRGIVQPSRWGGYELTPNWSGVYDDGRTRVAIQINALGDRDDPLEEQPTARLHVLLLGDSQMFGIALDKADTIEGNLEALAPGEVSAYNLGVHGYGPGDTLEHLRERSELRPTHTIFQLYGNDLRFDNCETGLHTAFEGYIVSRNRPDGTPYDATDLRRELAAADDVHPHRWISRLKSLVVLEDLHGRVNALLNPELILRAGPVDQFSDSCALSAAHEVDAIRALAVLRGQAFTVVVLPTTGEAALQRYSQPMQLAVDEIKRLGIPLLEVRPALTAGDYLPRDEHLAPSGAKKVAAAIYQRIRLP